MTPTDPAALTLLAAVRDTPGDAPLLALADWLAAHGRTAAGRDRAALIRVQVEIRRLRATYWDFRRVSVLPRYKQLEVEEAALLAAHLADWLGPWGPWIADPQCRAASLAGGLLRPYLQGLDWLAPMAADPAAWDWVDGLTLLSLTPADVGRLAASPVLAGLNSLNFGPDGWTDTGYFGDAGVRALAASPHLTRLRALTLGDCGVSGAGLRALVESPLLGRLHTLDLLGFDCTASNPVGDEGVIALAEAAAAAGLTRLSLATADVTDRGAAALAASPHLAGLTHLELVGNPIGPAGGLALAASPHLGRLRCLGFQVYFKHSWCIPPTADQLAAAAAAEQALRERFGDRWGGYTA